MKKRKITKTVEFELPNNLVETKLPVVICFNTYEQMNSFTETLSSISKDIKNRSIGMSDQYHVIFYTTKDDIYKGMVKDTEAWIESFHGKLGK